MAHSLWLKPVTVCTSFRLFLLLPACCLLPAACCLLLPAGLMCFIATYSYSHSVSEWGCLILRIVWHGMVQLSWLALALVPKAGFINVNDKQKGARYRTRWKHFLSRVFLSSCERIYFVWNRRLIRYIPTKRPDRPTEFSNSVPYTESVDC